MHRTLSRSLLSLGLLALCVPAQEQKVIDWHGTPLTLPAGWTTQAADEILLLLPPGWKQGERTGEAYGLLFDGDSKDLNSEELVDALDGAADALLSGSKRVGEPVGDRFGAVDGRTLRYALKNVSGEDVEVRMHAYLAKDGAAAFFALGFPAKLQSRDAELKGILASIGKADAGKPKKRAFGMGKKDEPAPAQPVVDAPPEPQNPLANPPRGDNPLANPPRGDNPLANPRAGNDPLAGGARRIQGGQEVSWQGVALDIPQGWRTQASDQDTLLLMPPGFGQSGVLDEIYALCGDGSIASLDAHDLIAKVRIGLDEIQPGMTPVGDAKAVKFGAIAGKEILFQGQTGDGQNVTAVVRVFPTRGGVRALLALGFPQKLQARDTEMQTILASLRPGNAGAAAAGGNVAQELVGSWVYFSNFNAVNGGGRMTNTTLNLRGDGSFVFDAETSSSNPFGGAGSQQHSEGTWSVDGATISFKTSTGIASYKLEKRNHPKNTNDPMIVLDGNAFVTATQRRPW